MPKVLFVVHGMGDHLPGWSSELVQQLDRTLASYPKFTGETQPFRDRVIIEEITYDAVFDKLIEPWGRNRVALEQFAHDHGIVLDDTLTALTFGQLPVDVSSFVWETLLDPVLYRGSPMVRDNVRQSVTRQFLNAWDKHLTSNPTTAEVKVSVLCHSQGTIVMSDVLSQVGEARRPEYIPFSSSKRSIDTVMTLANVSRLGIPTLIDIDSYKSCVRPQSAPAWKHGAVNYLRKLINVRHSFDPFCLWQRYDPTPSDQWGVDYIDIEGVRHVHQANTHGYLHYLLNPRTHIPLFRALLGPSAITKDHAKTAVDKFPDIIPDACATAIEEFRSSLNSLAATPIGSTGALDQFVMRGLDVYKAAKAAMTACPELVGGHESP